MSHRSLIRLIIYIIQVFTALISKIKSHSTQCMFEQPHIVSLYRLSKQRVHDLVGAGLKLRDVRGYVSIVYHTFCTTLSLILSKS